MSYGFMPNFDRVKMQREGQELIMFYEVRKNNNKKFGLRDF